MTKSKLTFLDYLLTIMYFINNCKHLHLLSRDIEINPDSKRSSIIFCHQNLNGVAVHGFIKAPLVEAFISTSNFDIVCLSETALDSTLPNDDEKMEINGYSLLRADHANDIKRGGVCIYFIESLTLSEELI